MKWKPHNYQKAAIKFLLEHSGAALFLDPGLGKTSITLGAIKILKNKGVVRRVLIIAPLRVCYNVWPLEIEKWDDFKDLRIIILHGKDKEYLINDDADIYLINPEGLEWFIEQKGMRIVKPDTLVVDESTKFKSWKSNRFKMLKPLLHKFYRRWILTGGPTPHSMLDLFSQMYIADLGRSLGQYISHYRNAFFEPGGYGGYGWFLIKGMETEIHKRIKKTVLRLDAQDYIKLPQKVFQNVYVDLPAKARKVYDGVEVELFAEIDRKNSISAVSQGVASMKCRQVASGAIYKDKDLLQPETFRKGTWTKIHDEKLEALQDLIDDLAGSPAIVLYYFKHELERIRKLLGKNTPCLSDCNMSELKQMVKDWNDDKLPVLLGHPDSMGHGLNLQEGRAQHIIFFSLTWNYDSFLQTILRLIRQGNKNARIVIHIIIVRDTVEEIMVSTLTMRGNNQKSLLDALKRYRKRRSK